MRTDNPTPKHSSFVTVAIELTVPLEKLGEEATSGRKKLGKDKLHRSSRIIPLNVIS